MYLTDVNRTDISLQNVDFRVATTTIIPQLSRHHPSLWKYVPVVLGVIFFAFGIVTLLVFFVKKCGSASVGGCFNGPSAFPDKPIKYSEIGNTHPNKYSEKSYIAGK